MISKGKTELVNIHLDGKEVEVPAGMNLIEAVALHGKEVPHYCYHPHLSIAGNCRMCLVEMGMPMRDRDRSFDQAISLRAAKLLRRWATSITPSVTALL